MADEDEDEIDEKFVKSFNKLFHKASAEREKRFKNSLVKDIGELVGSKLDEALGEKLGTVIEGKLAEFLKDDDGEQPTKGEGEKSGKLSPEIEATIRQAQKDAADAKAGMEKAKAEAAAEKAKSRKAEEMSMLTQGLTGKVKPALLNMVASQLHGSIVRDEDSDKVLWKNEEGEVLPFSDGLTAWLKSDAGKEVAPARPVGGTGGRSPDGGSPGKGQSGPLSPEDLSAIIAGSIPR